MVDEPQWEQVEALFDAAMERPAEQRLNWLVTACPDPMVRAVVARMLAAEARDDGPLDQVVDLTPFSLLTHLEAALGERYTFVEEIGRGGMATVFLARERKHDRPVVLKVLNPETARALGVDRFLAEIHAAAQLAHPHILPLIDSGEADGLLYFVMPWLGGETLRTMLRRERNLPRPLVLRFLHDLADALGTAHRAGIVHRDLKPENVLVVGEHAYLLDFGLVQFRSREGADRLTAQGAVLGTLGYMAPEQEAASTTDHRVDFYSWGVLARELLTGQAPGWIASAIPPTLPGDLPGPLLGVLRRCLNPDPAQRPTDATELVRAVSGASRATGARRMIGGDQRRTPLVLAGLVILVAGGWYATRARHASGDSVDRTAPVVVAPLSNETGDSTLGTWGRMAGDWITQGLQETGAATVIPWPYARQAGDRYALARSRGEQPDLVRLMQEETGAGIVITGAYYLAGNRVRFQAQITDARTGRLLAHAQPAEAHRDSVDVAVQQLRGRIMGAMAVWHDEDAVRMPGLVLNPPTFAAYQEFDRGIGLHLNQDYDSAATAYRRAFALDTTFGIALLYAATDLWNVNDYPAVDSLLQELRTRQLPLSDYHQQLATYFQALLIGEGERAFRTMQRALALSRDQRGGYTLAWSATATNHPREARAALLAIEPDRGNMRRWSPYWNQLAHAQHQLGDFAAEEEAAKSMQLRYPDNRSALVLLVRAAAARGDTHKIDSLMASMAGLSPDTYWSQGAALTVAGEELAAHGRGFVANQYLNQAVHWLANQLLRDPANRAHRYWIGSALYDAGRWPESAPYFESLAQDFPDRRDYRAWHALTVARAGRHAEALQILGPRPKYNPGEHTYMLARLAAIAGNRSEAISLLARCAEEGYSGWPWVHATAYRDFSILEGERDYQALFTYPAVRAEPSSP